MSANTKRTWSDSGESDETDEESPRKLVANDERRCKYCVKLLKNISEVEAHETKCDAALKNTAEIVDTKDGKKRFICDTCFRTFKFLTGFKKHKLRHEPPGGFICQYCEARYCSDFELQKHKELTHMAYKCQICKDKFNSKESYEEHIINVHDGRDRIYVVCEDCGAQFKTRTILSFHKQSNCGTFKPFKCDLCDSYFQNQWSLKNHKKIHKGEKKFCCSYCGNSFLNKGQLINHERRHTQEKPFVCEVCSKAFAHRESLVTHSSIHTGIKPYLCESCGACFSCIGNLIKHRRNRPQTCGLPQFTNTAKVAPRPSFRSGKFKSKTKIPKASMVLADNIKSMKINSENNKEIKTTNIEKIKESLENETTNEINSKTQIIVTNFDASEGVVLYQAEEDSSTICHVDLDDNKQPVILLKSESNNEFSEATYVVEVLEGNNDGNYDNFSTHDNMDITDFLDEEVDHHDNDSDSDEKSGIEIKEQLPEIGILNDIKQENDCMTDENCIDKKNKPVDEEESIVVEKAKNINDDYDNDSSSDDDVPLSKIRRTQVNKNNKKYSSRTFRKYKKSRKISKKVFKSISKSKNHEENNTELTEFAKINKAEPEVTKNYRSRQQRQRRNSLNVLIQENQLYECDQCPKIYQQRRPFAKHLVNVHKMNVLEVEEFIDNINRADNDNDKSSIRCKYCGKIYYQIAALKKHEILHGPDGNLIHKCRCCNNYFATPEKALKHARTDHADKLTCTICNKIYSCTEALVIHRKLVHEHEISIRKKANNVCQKCGRKFVNKTTLNDHERSNCGQNPLYKCEICNKQYHSAGTLKTHQNIHTGALIYKCSHCDKTCRTPGQLKVHERKHTGEKPFKCDMCDKAFAYRESLLTHYTLHTGIKRYTCYGCGQRFSCISNLQNHRRTHKDTCGILPLNSKANTSMGVSRGILCIGNKPDG